MLDKKIVLQKQMLISEYLLPITVGDQDNNLWHFSLPLSQMHKCPKPNGTDFRKGLISDIINDYFNHLNIMWGQIIGRASLIFDLFVLAPIEKHFFDWQN